jgi:hypothetical protein
VPQALSSRTRRAKGARMPNIVAYPVGYIGWIRISLIRSRSSRVVVALTADWSVFVTSDDATIV